VNCWKRKRIVALFPLYGVPPNTVYVLIYTRKVVNVAKKPYYTLVYVFDRRLRTGICLCYRHQRINGEMYTSLHPKDNKEAIPRSKLRIQLIQRTSVSSSDLCAFESKPHLRTRGQRSVNNVHCAWIFLILCEQRPLPLLSLSLIQSQFSRVNTWSAKAI
jgi:hypothetical protein